MPLFGVKHKEVGTSSVTLHTQCPECSAKDMIIITRAEWNAYTDGHHIQHAMVSLNADQREQLMTGYCKKCWNKSFKKDGE